VPAAASGAAGRAMLYLGFSYAIWRPPRRDSRILLQHNDGGLQYGEGSEGVALGSSDTDYGFSTSAIGEIVNALTILGKTSRALEVVRELSHSSKCRRKGKLRP
jgi:hypothetical protein